MFNGMFEKTRKIKEDFTPAESMDQSFSNYVQDYVEGVEYKLAKFDDLPDGAVKFEIIGYYDSDVENEEDATDYKGIVRRLGEDSYEATYEDGTKSAAKDPISAILGLEAPPPVGGSNV